MKQTDSCLCEITDKKSDWVNEKSIRRTNHEKNVRLTAKIYSYPNKKQKILIVFDEMIAYMLNKKNLILQ